MLVPRLFGSLMAGNGRLPAGDAVWGDTWVELPPERMRAQWVNVLTDQWVGAQPLGEAHGLLLAQVFERFPLCAAAREGRRPTASQPLNWI